MLTVFSAPNYCDRYRNKAAVLHIERPGYYTVNLLGETGHTSHRCRIDLDVVDVLGRVFGLEPSDLRYLISCGFIYLFIYFPSRYLFLCSVASGL